LGQVDAAQRDRLVTAARERRNAYMRACQNRSNIRLAGRVFEISNIGTILGNQRWRCDT
jgi:hypothetical protein